MGRALRWWKKKCAKYRAKIAPFGIFLSPGRRFRSPRTVTARYSSNLGERHALLALVLAAAIGVRGLAHLVGLEEEHLGDALVGVDLRRERRGVGKLEGDVPLPLRFQGSYVHHNSAAGIAGFSYRHGQHVARNLETLNPP